MSLEISATTPSNLLLGFPINQFAAKYAEIAFRSQSWAIKEKPYAILLANPNKLSHIQSRRYPNLGGADRDRTGGLLVANQALSQLSYSPFFSCQPSAFSHQEKDALPED
jgi:hypothetical protein